MSIYCLLLLLGYLSNQFPLLHRRPQILQYQQLHLFLRLECRSANMRQQKDLVTLQQALFDLGLVFIYVETSRPNLSQSVFSSQGKK